MLIEFIKPVKIKIQNKEKFIKAGSVLDLTEKVIEILEKRNSIIKLHPEITENCLKPFKCELIENGICIFIKSNMKYACLGPYRVTEDGGITSYLSEGG